MNLRKLFWICYNLRIQNRIVCENTVAQVFFNSSIVHCIKPNIQFNIVGAFAQTTQPPTCSPYYPIEHSGPSGTITSPGWPGDYPPNSTCTWFINCGQGGGPTPLELDGQGGGGCGGKNFKICPINLLEICIIQMSKAGCN